MKELSVENQIYLCKYHDIDNSLNVTLGISEDEASRILEKLKNNGLYEQYRKMDEFEYEKIVNKEKNKDKAQRILDRYKFDKSKTSFERIRETLKKCENYKNKEELNLNAIYKDIGEKLGIKSYIVANDCTKWLEESYQKNKAIFEMAGYWKKPTFKDFVVKELGLKNDFEQEKTDIQEAKEDICEVKASGNQELPEQTITVPLKMMYEYWYLKGFVDATEGNSLRKFK